MALNGVKITTKVYKADALAPPMYTLLWKIIKTNFYKSNFNRTKIFNKSTKTMRFYVRGFFYL